ncbi:MAG: RNA polymerase sigma factor [Verrucomicrobia bacterium]|nr:RNA polymerase sigma factor [Verrucomicrobiota bacterium]
MPDEPPAPRDFDSLYRATIAPLRRYLGRLLGNTSEAQDVAHDAYVRTYSSLTRPETQSPEGLLYTTARRLAINRLKRRSVAPFSHDAAKLENAATSAPGVAQQVMAEQELELLQRAIADLPEGCRTVLLLRKVELLSHREIADRLGIAISTVEKQHARALRLLRAALPAETLHSIAAPTATPETEATS